MKNILLFLASSAIAATCYPQITNFSIDYYSPREYGKGYEATNWACVQDNNGILYFGNAGGILQYDGVRWSFIPVKNRSVWIKTLAVSGENIIYAGAQNEFGYLAPDESGRLSYISLSDSLTDDKPPFMKIVHVWAWKTLVAFQYEEAVFIYKDGQLTTILPETSFHTSFLVNDDFYIRQRGVGIMKMTDEKLQLIKGTEYLKDIGIFSIIGSSDSSRNIMITSENGLWSVDRSTFIGSRMDLVDNTTFINSRIYGALKLSDGNIALNTLGNGIIITDEKLRILSVINKDNGLKVNGVLSLIQDYQGNLWAGLDNGIVQIHYSSPVSQFGSASGISGNIRAIDKFNGKLFIGTTDGLFTQNSNFKTLSEAFVHYGGISHEVKSLCLAGNRLIVGTSDELSEISVNGLSLIDDSEIHALHYSETFNLLFAATRRGFSLYRFVGRWLKLKDIKEITEEVVRIEEFVRNDTLTLWMGTSIQGAVRLQLGKDLNYKVDKYGSDDGLLADSWVVPFKLDDEIIFSQRNGLLSFVDEDTIRAQLPDSLRNRPEFYKGYFDIYNNEYLKDFANRPIYVLSDTRDKIYVNMDGELGYLSKDTEGGFIRQPFCLTDIGKINVFYHEDENNCWIGGDDGLLMYNEKYSKRYDVEYKTLITRVSCGTKDSVLRYGLPDHYSQVSGKEKISAEVNLPYSLNSVTFSFAAPFFEGEEKIRFSYMLSGQDTSFSGWNSENRISFRNLREGEYTFVVKAKNEYGHVSSEDSFRFKIMSPWYRTKLAYTAYIVIFALAVYIGIRLYTRRLVALNKKLEKTIEERTHEIHEKNVILESQKKEIIDSINYAQRIQNAVLPNDSLMKEYLGEYFILYRPKDIVSGDFYWAKRINQYTVFCVADCTGHGVPGAFMSMLCLSFIDEVVIKEKIFHPDTVLNRVRKMVIESLKQKGAMWEQKDGMDISLCFYNRDTLVIEFAGANNPLYIVRDKSNEQPPFPKQAENDKYSLYEIKADRMPVAFYDKLDPFTRQSFKVLRNDRLYLFSDGICDQIGGPFGKRFMYNSLRTLILETITPEIRDQKSLIENKIDEWIAYINPKSKLPNEQIDDICMLGIKT